MILEQPLHSQITFEVFPEDSDAPVRGDTYLDPRGKLWTVREVKPARTHVLRNPPPPVDGFSVTLEPDWPLNTLRPGEVLTPVKGIRCSGERWSGRIRRHEEPIQGFGTVTKGDVAYSWLLRVLGPDVVLRVGPRVEYENYFAGGVHVETAKTADVADVAAFVRAKLDAWSA